MVDFYVTPTTPLPVDQLGFLAEKQEADGFFAAAEQNYRLAGKTEDADRCLGQMRKSKDTQSGSLRGSTRT